MIYLGVETLSQRNEETEKQRNEEIPRERRGVREVKRSAENFAG
jgi:hypothetical protein